MGLSVATKPAQRERAAEPARPAAEPELVARDAGFEGLPRYLQKKGRAAAPPPRGGNGAPPDAGGLPRYLRSAGSETAADFSSMQLPPYLRAASVMRSRFKIAHANDPSEIEADRVAERAVRANPSVAPREPAASGGGEPLSREVRARVEPIVGASLADARVHTDAQSREMARSIGARAFTHGRDIALGPGESTGDLALLAHEATHVVQQRGRGDGLIQRDLTTPAPASGMQGYQPPGGNPPVPVCPPDGDAVLASEVVELKGHSTFDPSTTLADYLWCKSPGSVWVKVKFGSLAAGSVLVRATSKGVFETVHARPLIALTHPAFPQNSAALLVTVSANTIGGRIYWGTVTTTTTTVTTTTYGVSYTPLIPIYTVEVSYTTTNIAVSTSDSDLVPSSNILGWKGLDSLHLLPVVNSIAGGVMIYIASFDFLLDKGFKGRGGFAVVNEGQGFNANADIEAPGVPKQTMALQRAADNNIFGDVDLSYSMGPFDAFGGTWAGSLSGAFANGKLAVTGTASYSSDKLDGTVTIMLADEKTAWVNAAKQMPPSAQKAVGGTMVGTRNHVVTGWGTVDFMFNEWLTGTASVVLDPAGYVTSHGAIRPTKSFTFLTDDTLAASKELASAKAAGFYPVWGPTGVTGEIEGKLFAEGRVGPATIHDMELAGVFSTRPDVPILVSLGGVVDMSAIGRLRLELEGSLSYTLIGKHVKTVSLAVGVTGTGALKVYVRLEPKFTVTRAKGGDYEFIMDSVLKAAAGVDLGLSGYIKPSLFGFGPKFSMGKYQWHVGGLGVKTTLHYKLGDPDSLDLDWDKYDFDPSEFHGQAEKLLDDKAEKDKLKGGAHEDTVEGESDPATPKPALGPPKIYPFTMDGAPHQLWLVMDPFPTVMMASGDEGPLKPKLAAEAAITDDALKAVDPGVEQDKLRTKKRRVTSLIAQTTSVEKAADAVQAEDKETPDVAGEGELASAVGALGDQFEEKTLGLPVAEPVKPPNPKAEKVRKELIEMLKRPILHPGPFGKQPVAASSSTTWSAGEQRAVNTAGKLYGDHHTEADKGLDAPVGQANWTPDHMPASQIVELAKAEPDFGKVCVEAGHAITFVGQMLYPHTPASWRKQGGTVRGVGEKWEKFKRLDKTP